MNLKRLILSLFLLVSILQVSGQKTISGVVKEFSTGESLPYATISIKNSPIGTTSNLDGFFSLSGITNKAIVLCVSYIGYESKEIVIDTNDDFIKIELKESSQSLDEVVIKGSSNNMMKMTDKVGQITISPKNISALPSIGEKDIFRSMQLLPGVSGSNESSSGLFVRGGTPDQNLVLFDGFKVYHVDHFYGFFSAFNSNAIKDVQLYKGGFEAKYGGRISSVVELTGKEGNQKKIAGGFSAGSISASGYLELPLWGKGSVLIAYRRSLTDVIKSDLYKKIFDLNGKTSVAKTFEDKGLEKFVNEPDFYFYDFNSKATFKPTDKDVLSLSFYRGKDNLDNSRTNSSNSSSQFTNVSYNFINDIDDITKWGNMGVSFKWGRQWNTKLYSNFNISYSDYFSDRNRFSYSEIMNEDGESKTIQIGSLEDNDVLDYSIKNSYIYKINSNQELEFGVEGTFTDIKYNYDLNDTISIINRKDKGTIISSFIQDKFSLSNKLSITLGFRAVYFNNTERIYYEPRFQMVYKPVEGFKIKSAYGIYNQFAKRVVREDVMQGSRDFWTLCDNESVPIASATHYVTGISYETKSWLFDIEAYYKKMEGLSEFAPRISTSQSDNIENPKPFFKGDGYIQGIEFLVQRKFGDFTGWIAYTLSEVVNSFPGISPTDYPALHDTPSEIKVIGSYKVGNFNFAATWAYASGKPYTQPIGGYTLTMLDGSMIDYVAVGPKNASRLPDYHRLDLSANYNFKIGNSKCELGVSLFNLYNRQNVWYKEFEKIEDKFIETDVNFIGFSPNLFFSLKF